jgi:hypothetical protein
MHGRVLDGARGVPKKELPWTERNELGERAEGHYRYLGLSKLRGSHVTPLPYGFNAETRRKALLGVILIVKTPGSTRLLV